MVGSLKRGRSYIKIPTMQLLSWTSRMHLAPCIERRAWNNWKACRSTSTLATSQQKPLKPTGYHSAVWGKYDSLSTLVFATSMALLLKDILRTEAPAVQLVADADDTVLLRNNCHPNRGCKGRPQTTEGKDAGLVVQTTIDSYLGPGRNCVSSWSICNANSPRQVHPQPLSACPTRTRS